MAIETDGVMKDWQYRLGIALGVILFLGLAIGAVGLAQQTSPQIEGDPAALIPGGDGAITVSGFRAGERIRLVVNVHEGNTPFVTLGEYTVPADGTFTIRVAIPETWADGSPVMPDGLTLQAISADGTSLATLPLAISPGG